MALWAQILLLLEEINQAERLVDEKMWCPLAISLRKEKLFRNHSSDLPRGL